MKYKVGDKVIVHDDTSRVYTIDYIDHDEGVILPYRVHWEWGKDEFYWCGEKDLSPAGNLLDPEEATEEFARLLDSGFYDEPIGITPRNDGRSSERRTYERGRDIKGVNPSGGQKGSI